jgi:hypothetical protein
MHKTETISYACIPLKTLSLVRHSFFSIFYLDIEVLLQQVYPILEGPLGLCIEHENVLRTWKNYDTET